MRLIGVKIYKGTTNNLFNINATLKNPFSFDKVNSIKSERVKKILKNLGDMNKEIYVWAGVQKVVKKINHKDLIVFVTENDGSYKRVPEAYIFTYLGSVYDENDEIRDYVGWKGNDWKNVVFLQNKKEFELKSIDFERIVELTRARFETKGFAGWKQEKWVLQKEEADELINLFEKR